jgi:hypothetical protein
LIDGLVCEPPYKISTRDKVLKDDGQVARADPKGSTTVWQFVMGETLILTGPPVIFIPDWGIRAKAVTIPG